MVVIKKNAFLHKCIAGMMIFFVLFMTSLTYFLGWEFEIKSFLIYLAITLDGIGLVLLILLICLKCNKKVFVIDSQKLTFYHGKQQIYSIDKSSFKNMTYTAWHWVFCLKIWAGYLKFELEESAQEYGLKPMLVFREGKKIYGISMSTKQAKELAKVWNSNFEIES